MVWEGEAVRPTPIPILADSVSFLRPCVALVPPTRSGAGVVFGGGSSSYGLGPASRGAFSCRHTSGVSCHRGDYLALRAFPMQYAITAGFLLAVVAGSFATVILVGYGIAHLIAFVL